MFKITHAINHDRVQIEYISYMQCSLILHKYLLHSLNLPPSVPLSSGKSPVLTPCKYMVGIYLSSITFIRRLWASTITYYGRSHFTVTVDHLNEFMQTHFSLSKMKPWLNQQRDSCKVSFKMAEESKTSKFCFKL